MIKRILAKTTFWEIGLSLLVAIIGLIPQIFAALKTPAGTYFVGVNTIVNLNDVLGVYLAAINHFSQGAFLYENPYQEDDKIFFHYPVYLVVGKIAGFLNISGVLVYQILVFVLAFWLSLFIFKFLKLFFAGFWDRLLAFGLVNIGGFLPQVPEANGLFSHFFPHFSVAQLGFFASWYSLMLVESRGLGRQWRPLLMSALLVVVIHPWMILVLATLYSVWVIWLFVKGKLIRDQLAALGMMVVISAPFLTYFTLNINWVSYRLPLDILGAFSVFGLFLPIAFLGLFVTSGGRIGSLSNMLGIWFVGQLLFAFLPLPFARRFLEGIYLPMAILATGAISWYLVRFGHGLNRGLFYTCALFYLSIGLIGFYLAHFVWLPNKSIYRPIEQKQAMIYLDQYATSRERVLSHPSTGIYMASLVDLKIYAGHGIQTADFDKKSREINIFLGGQMSGIQRENFLRSEQICYVYIGPDERKLLAFDADYEGYWQRLYTNRLVTIYKTNWCESDEIAFSNG